MRKESYYRSQAPVDAGAFYGKTFAGGNEGILYILRGDARTRRPFVSGILGLSQGWQSPTENGGAGAAWGRVVKLGIRYFACLKAPWLLLGMNCRGSSMN